MRTIQQLFDLTGKVAIVTGGGTHIGKAMTEALCEAGASVVIASRRGEMCRQVAEEIARKHPGRCVGTGCDAADEAQVNKLIEFACAQFGGVDIMVNNAGGAPIKTNLPNASLDDFNRTIAVNATATLLCSQAAARVMMKRGGGKIINVGSIYGVLGGIPALYVGTDMIPANIHYVAAKGAVVNMTRHLATTFGPHNIQVNCISPGGIARNQPAPFVERYLQRTPAGRMGTEEDLKGVTVLLASSASDWITGQNVMVDGGWTAW